MEKEDDISGLAFCITRGSSIDEMLRAAPQKVERIRGADIRAFTVCAIAWARADGKSRLEGAKLEIRGPTLFRDERTVRLPTWVRGEDLATCSLMIFPPDFGAYTAIVSRDGTPIHVRSMTITPDD